ncbi:hypothetical protein GLYMA_20G087150v4 [Glycine max]|nr:hypothetical protein GLYMA_20G087150v4 [Glycine max]KAH1035202.1 hypothetical protein GYH30_055264 [Glycine max]
MVSYLIPHLWCLKGLEQSRMEDGGRELYQTTGIMAQGGGKMATFRLTHENRVPSYADNTIPVPLVNQTLDLRNPLEDIIPFGSKEPKGKDKHKNKKWSQDHKSG